MSLCFTEEDTEKLARGWPYLIVPIDGQKADKTSAAASKAFYASDPIFFTEWPRKTLHRYLRFGLPMWNVGDDDAAKAALEDDTVPAADDLLALLRKRFRRGTYKGPFHYRNLVWGVEAIAGTDATLDAITEEMEVPDESVPSSTIVDVREAIVTATSFMLLRASLSVATSARERMDRVLRSTQDAGELFEAYRGAIDFVLHGAAGTKRFLEKWPNPVWLEVPTMYCSASLDYAIDDGPFVRELLTKSRPLSNGMSVRVAALGGPEALALLPKRKWPAVQMPAVVRDFGMIRAPEM
jgi:hypothetical protein